MFRYSKTLNPAIPVPEIEIFGSSSNSGKAFKIPAILDTGADVTCIPYEHLRALGEKIYEYVELTGVAGTEKAKKYFIDLKIADCTFANHSVVSVNLPFAILGRDIINNYTVILDGPHNRWRVEKNVK